LKIKPLGGRENQSVGHNANCAKKAWANVFIDARNYVMFIKVESITDLFV